MIQINTSNLGVNLPCDGEAGPFLSGSYSRRLLCGAEFIVFVQRLESAARVLFFMVANEMKGFHPLALDKHW